jgi:hypothetical protein
MVITTSAAWTISSVQGSGYPPVMSMPRSAIASIAAERPALWVQRNSTIGRPETSRWVSQSLYFGQCPQALPGEAFGKQGQEVGYRGAAGELVVGGVQESFRWSPR